MATIDRRRLLKASSALALGVDLAQLAVRGEAGSGLQRAAASRGAWQELAGALAGRLLPGDADFARIAQPWNLRFAAILPGGIARCVSAEDVRTCLLWAQANGVALVARSGGHSYAGYSATTGLMIDLSPMNQVDYDAGSGLARLGGGARNADLYRNLRPVSRAVTHGRCGGVGVAGLVLGGGIGFNQRLHGLTCDQLVETEVVTAAGELLRCTEREHADLFWAWRGGGGGNFGVNTSLTFQTFPVDMLTVYQISWTSNLDSLLPAMLDLLPATTERLGGKLSVINDGSGLTMDLLGQIVGTPGELQALLDPLYRLAQPSRETVQVRSYWDGQDFLSEDDAPEYSHDRSRYVFRPVPADGARTILEYLRRWPGTRRHGLEDVPGGRRDSRGAAGCYRLRASRRDDDQQHRAELDSGRQRRDGGGQRGVAGRFPQGDAVVYVGALLPELHRRGADRLPARLLRREPAAAGGGQAAVRSAQRVQFPAERAAGAGRSRLGAALTSERASGRRDRRTT